MASIEDLLQQVDRILELDPASAALEQEIARYASCFECWQEENQELLNGPGDAVQRELLERLQEKHNAVVDLALALKEEVGSEIRRLKAHGKGLLIYTDNMPKRISTMVPKKW